MIWDEVHTGGSLAVVGAGAAVPPAPAGWRVVRVRCGGPPRALDALHRARARVDRLLGQQELVDRAAARLRSGIRRRLLDEGESFAGEGLIASLDRLADTGAQPTALIFEAVELADAATLALLRRAVERPALLRPALVLCFEREPAGGPAARLLEAVRAAGQVIATAAPAPLATPAPPPERRLRPEALRVLRAAAVAGPGFEAELVARLLDLAPLRVLEHLQEAIDAGVALSDLGEGRFHLDEALAERLRGAITPSLAEAWNRMLAELVQIAPGAYVPEDLTPDEDTATEEAPDIGMAAGYLAAAGEAERAALRYLDAARRAGPEALPVAVAQVRAAFEMLDGLPETPERRVIRVRAHAIYGRLMWAGAGEGFTLAGALEQLQRAEALMDGDTPLEARAEVETLIGWVCYDLGDPASLERALEALTEASRLLTRAGRSAAAAELLNDQASVWVRLGDPLRAVHLLRESRELFSKMGDAPVVRIELAETEHQLARLPLVVEAQPGEREASLERALEHAASAAALYEGLGMRRELARVGETVGRLRWARGELEPARAELSEVFQAQRRLGDLLGLARTSAALAQVLADGGRLLEALEMLHISVELNRAKGSPRGLAYNRRGLEALAARIGGGPLADRLAAIEAELALGERRWGRLDVRA